MVKGIIAVFLSQTAVSIIKGIMSTVSRLTADWETFEEMILSWVRRLEEQTEYFLNINSVLNEQRMREAHSSVHYEDSFLWRQGHPSFFEQFTNDLPWISESRGICVAGLARSEWCNVYIHRIRGWATQIDRWKRCVLPHMQTAATNIRYPWVCVNVAGSVSVQLSISGHRVRLYTEAGVTPVYSHNVCLLSLIRCIMTVCSTDVSQREQRVSDSNSCIYGW